MEESSASAEPRALSMSLDDIIREKRQKEGRPDNRNQRSTRGGAHFVHNKKGGKNTYHFERPPARSVRVSYNWSADSTGDECVVMETEGAKLVKICASGDIVIYSDVEHDWKVFTPMNTCLAPLGLKVYFEGDIRSAWTVKNEAGWNRILDKDV